MPAINDNKLTIWDGRLGFGPECCGCCCVDGETDPTKKSRGDCHDAGGTWYPGIPCSEYPICSECFECDALPEGTTVTARVKAWLPPFDVRGPDWFAPGPFVPDITNCPEQGPFEAEFELSPIIENNPPAPPTPNPSYWFGFALVDVGDGTFIVLEASFFCGDTGICEGHSLWQSLGSVYHPGCNGSPYDAPGCGTFCMVPFGGSGFCRLSGETLYHSSEVDGDQCRPQSASKYSEGAAVETGVGFGFEPVGCEWAVDLEITIEYP